MILVTGASGKVGAEAVRLLAEGQHATRALVRDSSRAPRGATEVAVADLDRPETLDEPLTGVDTVVLISPSVPEQEIAVIDSAVRHGVTHIVKITNHKATADSPVGRRRDHARVEAHLRATGMRHTLLAPNFFLQNLLAIAPTVKESHGFTMSTGDGRIGMVDARDVAATAATIAASPAPHAGHTYLLTGPELVTYDDVAAALGAALGREIEYRRISPGAHRDVMIRAGVPEPVATSNAQVFGLLADGDAEWLSGDVERITGKAPRSLRTFVEDHLAAFA
ncbi:NmrA family NAD(P)-binding protein [Amycolatopsis sp. CA-230715]|uniref:NmrA family NAD(P)-binding protein n=1 Tax=Amycolatopsis sp. CA-230715 TaxID=2745196 RepID=UPI001C0276FB|nr:NmrA family NAD(P)-binding protein [Amycolatopsis sp. CA-230715]QWF82003.1 NAD(P)H azoreductase [Amycolatopsis sp. CA-230715]